MSFDSRSEMDHDPAELVGQPVVGASGVTYHLGALLATGVQGWRFAVEGDDRIVAKVFRRPSSQMMCTLLASDVTYEKRLDDFPREAAMLCAASRAGTLSGRVLPYVDHGLVTERPAFVITEAFEGSSVSDLLVQPRSREGGGGVVSTAEIRVLAERVANALMALHAAGIVHGNLKPSNVLVPRDGGVSRALLADPGPVRKPRSGELPQGVLAADHLTPEQTSGEVATKLSDVFAFAALVTQMLTGDWPHMAGLSKPIEEVTLRDAELRAALHWRPEHRPSSVERFWNYLAPML